MLVGTRMSFREVVDGARVASCLVKVSFCEVVDSAPQASVHEVVDGCTAFNRTAFNRMERADRSVGGYIRRAPQASFHEVVDSCLR